MDANVVGIDFQRPSVMTDGVLQPLSHGEHVTEVVVRIGEIRVGF